MDTTTKKPTQAPEELNEDILIMNFVMEFRDQNPAFDSYIDTATLSSMIAAFKRKYVDANWYNAGIMAQRILQNDEIETLKKKLKQAEFNHTNTRISWDSTIAERDELKTRCKALEDRLVIVTNNAEADRRQIAYAAWRAAADAFRMYPDNKHTFSDYWEAVQ
jgi:hypothetical protein